MDSPECRVAAMRRGSYDDAAAPLRPHLRNLAQRRRSAPSLVFGKALGMPWSPIREEASCWVSVEQSPFVHGLTSENGELLLDECVQVTEGSKTRERHLFLFSDVIVFAKIKSTSSYRLKHRVSLEDVWLHGFEDELEDYEEGATGDTDLRVTLVLAWELSVCLVCFCSPEVKERWLDTLHRKISDAKARAGCASSPPDVLMKVLSSSVAIKTLTGGGMEQFIEFQLDGNVKIPKPLSNQEDRPAPPIDGKWNPLRRLKKCQSFTNKGGQSNAKTPQLFGRPLSKICQDPCSLPKPVSEMLLLLKKRGPSAEGVFRKPCNSKNMREVREKLNGGLEVDMEGQPVTLLVGLLKSFLKELPGSLLVSELYDSWVAALDNEDAQQRGAAIRSMVDKLPAPNRLLLQHLLCVFHHILESSDVNKMDAYNLAVCIGPSLLQLDATALDEQKEKTQKVTELTQFLIEHFEILGENIPNLLDTDEDSLSSQHHDSAYDSTDPDGDGEAGESSMHGGCSSSSSLSPSIAASPWPSDTALSTKSPFNRRCSEPIILLSADIRCLHGGHARSHDDCSMASGLAFKDQPLTKQISDDSFLLRGRGLSFPKLSPASNMDPMLYSVGHNKDCSCSSLESAASNQSEGSVFSSSPVGSPPSSKKANSNQAVASVRAPQDSSKPDEKKRSQSMRVANKVLMRTRSLGAFSRTSLKRDSQKDFPCETLQEDSQSEADSPSEHKPRPLSAIEVFKQVDSRLPCRPPSYEHAVHNGRAPRRLGSMTVHDAIRLERRSRPSSLHYDRPSTCAVNQYADCFGTQESACAVEQRVSFRQRAMSESVSAGHHEAVSRRCSQPVFEEFSYAKESYV